MLRGYRRISFKHKHLTPAEREAVSQRQRKFKNHFETLVKDLSEAINLGHIKSLTALLETVREQVFFMITANKLEADTVVKEADRFYISDMCPLFGWDHKHRLPRTSKELSELGLSEYLALHPDADQSLAQRFWEIAVLEGLMLQYPHDQKHLPRFRYNKDLEIPVLRHAGMQGSCPKCETTYLGSLHPYCPECGTLTLFHVPTDLLVNEMNRRGVWYDEA